MNGLFRVLAAAVCGLFLGVPAALGGDIPIYHFINFGNTGDELTVHPHVLTLRVGETYQFVVSNPSKQRHVVAARDLMAAVKTTQLTRGMPPVAWPYPGMSEGIPLRPGQIVEWTFTPLAEGIYKFGCDKPGHAAAGMHVTIQVTKQKVL